MTTLSHQPVLLNEVLTSLAPQAGQTYLDCTAGLGGHAAAIAERLGPRGRVILIDLDASNLAAAAARVRALPDAPTVETIHASFAETPHRLAALSARADMVLADLGFASNQVDDAARGLSFMRDGPLDMRMNSSARLTAAELVATFSEPQLTSAIRQFGEDRHAPRIARAIIAARKLAPIERTTQLADIIRAAVPRAPADTIDPATRTFQALRIVVNDEIGNLDALLDTLSDAARAARTPRPPRPMFLNPGARIGIIAFHSLEDRPVKQAFLALTSAAVAKPIGEQPQTATPDEAHTNPRARSAKLRAIALT
ncbi:MAG: 16S rRNA (cytosine(1402)-N(4))-methyltransferase RsmH [Phycisphaerales bacterium]|nr:16S rRNA (cytosine(1402)-N(4))-methyltransferase RsmH [Phycisphaerales bacterium]